MEWFVYVLESQCQTRTYVGISPDPETRLAQHNGEEKGGAKSTRAGRPWSVVKIYGAFESRAEAQRAEYSVKRLSGRARLAWTGFDDE